MRRFSPRSGSSGPNADSTFEESRYLRYLSQSKKQVAIKLCDGITVQGWVEYFDNDFIRLTRDGEPNLFIFKHDIVYISEYSERRVESSRPRTNTRYTGQSSDRLSLSQNHYPDAGAGRGRGTPRRGMREKT